MPENESFNEKPTPSPIDKNQKIAVAGLAVFAILVVILWMVQLKNNIYGPFNSTTSQNQVATEEENSDAALKVKDTDADGLNDYDELNTYKTSPYLEDTDGDGFKDGDEIDKGYDPNCPQGKTCTGGLLDNTAVDQTETMDNTTNTLLNQLGGANLSATSSSSGATTSLTSDQLSALKNLDAASLRQLLLQQGMDKATLDNISDADLLKSFQETLNGQ
ncbi:MAG: hypothetical protein WC349_04245 [Patescibacteria group bacterium]|jgi:hypothetical protein